MCSTMERFAVWLVVLMTVYASTKDVQEASDDIRVQVLGKSGQIRLWRELTDGNKTKPVIMLFDSLAEMGDMGKPVGTTQTPKHSFNTFGAQEFTFTDPVAAGVPFSDVAKDTTAAKMFSFSGQLTALMSKLTAMVYLMKKDAMMTLGTEMFNVTKGQVKISLKLEKWEFCAPCMKGKTEENGSFLDLVITLMSRGKPSKRSEGAAKGGVSYDLGASDTIELSEMIEVDDVWMAMEAGYPKFEQKNNKNMFTFRFPKFNNTLVYDPSFSLGSVDESDPNDDPTGAATRPVVTVGIASLLVALFAALLH